MAAKKRTGGIARAATAATRPAPSTGAAARESKGTQRFTCDMGKALREDMRRWSAQVYLEHGDQVDLAPVTRAMLRMLLADKELSARVLERVKAGDGAL